MRATCSTALPMKGAADSDHAAEFPMEVFTTTDLHERAADLVRNAEDGQLSVVTENGEPLFIAVPFDELLLKEGSRVALAVRLFEQGCISLNQAAALAGRSNDELTVLLGQ